MKSEILKIAEQLASEAQRIRFGEISIKIIIHDGQARTIERTVTEKIRPE